MIPRKKDEVFRMLPGFMLAQFLSEHFDQMNGEIAKTSIRDADSYLMDSMNESDRVAFIEQLKTGKILWCMRQIFMPDDAKKVVVQICNGMAFIEMKITQVIIGRDGTTVGIACEKR
jgi:hypothetical protein